jgi:hypothetical protein
MMLRTPTLGGQSQEIFGLQAFSSVNHICTPDPLPTIVLFWASNSLSMPNLNFDGTVVQVRQSHD